MPLANRPSTLLERVYCAEGPRRIIWEFQRERYSDLHLKKGEDGRTALEIAEDEGKDEVAALLRGLVTVDSSSKNQSGSSSSSSQASSSDSDSFDDD